MNGMTQMVHFDQVEAVWYINNITNHSLQYRKLLNTTIKSL